MSEKASSEKIKVHLPDGSEMELTRGVTASDVAGKIGPRLAKDAVAAIVNDVEVDMG